MYACAHYTQTHTWIARYRRHRRSFYQRSLEVLSLLGQNWEKAANIFAYTLTILSAFKASEVFIKLKVLLVVSSKRYAHSLLLCVGIYPVRITPTHQVDRK